MDAFFMRCVAIRHDAPMHIRGRIVTDRNATYEKRIRVGRGYFFLYDTRCRDHVWGRLTRHRLGGGGSDPTPVDFSGITSSSFTLSTRNLANLPGNQFGVVSCKKSKSAGNFLL